MSQSSTSLGATIRAWRDRLSPAAAGLPQSRARRAKGLRREELSELAMISVDYVVRLEQGRSVTPSAQVVSSLARALQLTAEERGHLYQLAGLAAPSDLEVSDHIPPGLRRLTQRLESSAAVAVFAADWQLIWWNQAWAALLGDPSAKEHQALNFARDTFRAEGADPQLSHWPVRSNSQAEVEIAVVGDLRRSSGRYPHSRRLAALIEELTSTSTLFHRLWSSGEVGPHQEDRKVVQHPAVGELRVDCDVLTDGDADRKIVVLTAEAGSEDETKLQLAIIAGAQRTGSHQAI